MNAQQLADIPTLASLFSEEWPDDDPKDADYPAPPSAVDFPDADSDSASESEDSDDSGVEEGPEITLTEDQVDMLSKHIPEFRVADQHRRSEIVEERVTWIEERWPGQPNAPFNRKKVQTLVRRYMHSKGRRPKKASALTLGRKWTFRDVVIDVHRGELHNMALSMSDSKAGSPDYLQCYQKALKTILDGLSDDDKSKYRAQAKKLTEETLLPRQQIRMMEKFGPRAFREFAKYAYRQFGARIAILAGYRDTDGGPTVTLFDVNERLGATSFRGRHAKWEDDPFVQDFSDWVADCFGQPSCNGNDEGQIKSNAALQIEFQTDAQGYPMLPSWETIKDTKLLRKKLLIGKFLAEMHTMAGGGHGRISWTRLEKAQNDYIEAEYLPAGIILKQYHHLRSSTVNALLEHWTTRQAAGQRPFRFKRAVPVIRPPEEPVFDHMGPANWQDDIDEAQEQRSNESGDLNEHPGLSTRLQHRSRHVSGDSVDRADEKQVGPVIKQNPPPPRQSPAPPHHSPANSSRLYQATERSPQDLMRKPWGDKFQFLVSLSKDGKYQELLREINQMFLSNHVIYVTPSVHHPAWALWTWPEAWLSQDFHSGGEEPVWEWLQSRPYVSELLPEQGACGDFSVDGIALGIGSLLRDMEASQFSDEFHPPQHVAQSTVGFDTIETIVHPILDDFLQILRGHNNNITDDHQMEPAAPNYCPEQRATGKRRRKINDEDADNTRTENYKLSNRQKVDKQVSSVLPQTRRSGRERRPTESARAMQENRAKKTSRLASRSKE